MKISFILKSNEILQPGTVNMSDMIRQEFAKYGEIKSVEMLMHPVERQDEAAAEICEAFVTFVKSKSAHQAFMAYRKHGKFPKETITILPADSWRQEQQNNTGLGYQTKTEEGAVALNEMLAKLSMKNEAPADLEKKLLVDIDADISLKKWHSIALSLKHELEYILLKLSSKSTEANQNPNRLTINEYEKRVVQVIANNSVGAKFKAMSIVKNSTISSEILCCMAPLLQQLRSLIIDSPLNSNMIYKLPKFCPQLRMLRQFGIWDGINEHELPVNWPSLGILVFMNRYLDVKSFTENGKKFRRFIELNPQLNMLLLHTIIDIELLKAIVNNLINIRALSFRRLNYFKFTLILEHLTKAEALNLISIQFHMAEKVDLEKIVIMADRLGKMKNIRLVTLTQNYMPNTEQKEEFPMLNIFPVTEHQNCDCHRHNKRILSFDGILPDLEVPDDVPILVVIINTNNPIKSLDKSLDTDILNTLEETKKSFSYVIRFDVLKKENQSIYIHVAYA